MKTYRSRQSSTQANVILVALILSAIGGLTLASYLVMVQQQNTSIYRSQTWNASMAISEAGIEDGLEMVNRYAGQFVPIDMWTNYTAVENWEVSGNVYHVHRTLNTDGYDVWITNQPPAPQITCQANLAWNYASLSSGAGQPFFAQIGSTAVPQKLSRRVWIQTKRDPLFAVAMAALNGINLKGNKITTDSFDSSSTNYSINGLYPYGHLEMTKAGGDICTDSSLYDSLHVGNADVKGHIRTGPGVGTYTIGANGSVGSRPWVEGGNLGVQPGWASTDFNVAFPTVDLPRDASWLPATVRNSYIDGVKYEYIFDDASPGYHDYSISSLNGSIYIATNANVRIKISQSVSSSTMVIRLSPVNATLQIFMQGSAFTLGGGALIDNPSGHPDRFFLYGLPSCTSVTFGGNGNFYGCIYTPNADFYLGGGGSDTWDFVGSSVTSTVTMNGHYNFHFDENLRNVGPAKAYVAYSWEEIAAH